MPHDLIVVGSFSLGILTYQLIKYLVKRRFHKI